jgi:hypothetical protein
METLPQFDLSRVSGQLRASGLAESEIVVLENEYRRFLALCKQYRPQPIVPPPTVDRVWHQHILNTRSYEEDCKQYFGFFLHHNVTPTSERRTDERRRTLELYKTLFGDPPEAIWTYSATAFDCD